MGAQRRRFGGVSYGAGDDVGGLARVLVISRVVQQAAFTFLAAGIVYSEQLIVCPFNTRAIFGAPQSRPHEVWARFFDSSMKDNLSYAPSDCFETFPFPRTGKCTRTSKPPAKATTTSARR